MNRLQACFATALAGFVSICVTAGSAQANQWFEPAPIDAPTAATTVNAEIELAQSQQVKTPAQLALEEANKSNSKKKKKNKKRKKRRGSFK